jgi:hypothetical protein
LDRQDGGILWHAGFKLRRGILQAAFIPRRDRHPHPFLDEGPGDCKTDPAAPARDNRNLIFKPVHKLNHTMKILRAAI